VVWVEPTQVKAAKRFWPNVRVASRCLVFNFLPFRPKISDGDSRLERYLLFFVEEVLHSYATS
jgi:hypothetical protein